MDDLSQDEKQNISKFVEYSLMLIVKGFDEMDINQRLEFVKLFGSIMEISINKDLKKISKLEDKICVLEDKIKLLESKNKKK